MLTGRLLIMLVVLTATLAVRTPAPAQAAEPSAVPVERTTWVQRLGAGVTRSFSRIGLMQRVALRLPTPRLSHVTAHSTSSFAPATPDPLRTCLPPPYPA